MNNIPVVKLGLIAVSRDCFPIQLSEKRRAAIMDAYKLSVMHLLFSLETSDQRLQRP